MEFDPTGATGLRLHTRAPATLPWLARHVVPVARDLAGEGGRVVFLRQGWQHGPHVDIVARRAFGPAPDWETLAARLDAGPLDPATALSTEVYLARARELGKLEGIPEPYPPMRPHGAVDLLYADEFAGEHAELTRLRDVVLGITGKPLMRTIDELAADPALATTRLAESFLALADTHPLGLAYGALSLRYHVESFLSAAVPSRKVRTTFAHRLLAEADQLHAVVTAWLADMPSASAVGWKTAFAYCAGALDHSAASGHLTSGLLESVSGAPQEPSDGPFQRALAASSSGEQPSPFFASYRLLTTLFYQQLPLLTVSPLQRYYMCWAIAETIDEVLGESWQDRLVTQRWEPAAFVH
ncbi:hypothetical protein [Dactylosporangium sp. NPDC051484]|uniref:hypothetical protein n=1 Tax=Dactylosporangium sp. NPDC051484 TaxID=3154942 RepID=UPI00344E380C